MLMSDSAFNRIWSEICAIQSDKTRAHMIDTVFAVPDYVAGARRTGVYGPALAWASAYRGGYATPFPFISSGSSSYSSTTDRQRYLYSDVDDDFPRLQVSETSQQQIVVSPAAKALDYFQEALDMLGLDEDADLTREHLRAAYKRASLWAHPDKGGSKEKFDELRKAYHYVERILDRIKPRTSEEEAARMKAPVSMETAKAARDASAPVAPVKLSAKKLNMDMFNKLFEENRLPDPHRDLGYGDWMKSANEDDERGGQKRFGSMNAWEDAFKQRAVQQATANREAITVRHAPDAIIAPVGMELGADTRSFTAAFGADSQFTDLKEAYTTGASVFHEVGHIKVVERSAKNVKEAERIRAEEMARVDPDESSRIAAAAAALEERERQRRLRLAQTDTAMDSWSERMRGRLMVSDS
jgi:hypothetical protein